MFVFSIRPIWLELGVPMRIFRNCTHFYFGNTTREITDRNEAITMLQGIVSKIQSQMIQRFENHNVKEDIKALYKILDEVYRLYYSQKMARQKLSEQNVHDEQFEQSRNIAINIIDATNLWIENSLNNSGVITDYDKMFKKDGYYDHCRHRYDLVLQEPEKMRQFIGAAGEVEVHFLFVSSKPLEVEFQDEDHIVSFLCLSIFDKYLEGKLESVDGKKSVRPTIRI